jgi:HD-like signal output (HDOD) protein
MLPAAPKTYIALNEALMRPNCAVSDVVRIIERDVGLCAKMLQLVNSAFFGLPRRISSLDEAVTYIGTSTIKNLAMALEAFAAASKSCGLSGPDLAALQNHSLLAGQIARRIHSGDKTKAEESFLAGVLHEVGWLVGVDIPVKASGPPAVDRALLGAYLLGLWGLPHPIIEAVAYHQDPQLLPHADFELVDVLYLAHYLAAELVGGMVVRKLDCDYLLHKGIGEAQLADLRVMVSQLAGQLAE